MWDTEARSATLPQYISLKVLHVERTVGDAFKYFISMKYRVYFSCHLFQN